MTTVTVTRMTHRFGRTVNGAWAQRSTEHDTFSMDEDRLRPQTLASGYKAPFDVGHGIEVRWPDGVVERAFPFNGGASPGYPAHCIPADGRLSWLLSSAREQEGALKQTRQPSATVFHWAIPQVDESQLGSEKVAQRDQYRHRLHFGPASALAELIESEALMRDLRIELRPVARVSDLPGIGPAPGVGGWTERFGPALESAYERTNHIHWNWARNPGVRALNASRSTSVGDLMRLDPGSAGGPDDAPTWFYVDNMGFAPLSSAQQEQLEQRFGPQCAAQGLEQVEGLGAAADDLIECEEAGSGLPVPRIV
jgi:hypothetical protein